jgi:hypothetical protein
MNKKQIIQKLKKYHKMPPMEQITQKVELLELCKKFWDSKPTEQEFGLVMSRIVQFPEFIYYILKK